MLFNSFEFAIFALIVFPVYAILSGRPLRVWLVAMSYVFYGWANPWYILLLVFSTVLDFSIGLRMQASSSQVVRKRLLRLSLAGNLGLLAVFKYSGFFVETLNDCAQRLGFDAGLTVPNIALPIGISFYTFQTLSYTIDVYRGNVTATRSFTTFALYVAFFPQLVAGPIERASHLLDQLKEKQAFRKDDVLAGATRIMWGLTKKIVFADRLGIYVGKVYAAPGLALSHEIVLATYMFGMQIYLDFSAYSDIAIGLARMMGINLRENFRWPYLSRNISEFWQRWHISLSTWLRDYLYIPLSVAARGKARSGLNLVIVMALAGLWHGADVKFVVWGLWLGLALAIYHSYASFFGRSSALHAKSSWRDLPAILLTFHVVTVSWVLFRAPSLGKAMVMLRAVLTFDDSSRRAQLSEEEFFAGAMTLAFVLALHLLRGLGFGTNWTKERSPALHGVIWGALIVFMILMRAPTGTRFIYFQF